MRFLAYKICIVSGQPWPKNQNDWCTGRLIKLIKLLILHGENAFSSVAFISCFIFLLILVSCKMHCDTYFFHIFCFFHSFFVAKNKFKKKYSARKPRSARFFHLDEAFEECSLFKNAYIAADEARQKNSFSQIRPQIDFQKETNLDQMP